jgi:6-phosphogluconate dehydrogenase
MSKQQVSRIKKVLTILLAVLFAVSLAAAAASNVNYYKKMNLSNGWHNIIVNFSDFGGAHFFETYTGDYGNKYTQHIEDLNETMYNGNLY